MIQETTPVPIDVQLIQYVVQGGAVAAVIVTVLLFLKFMREEREEHAKDRASAREQFREMLTTQASAHDKTEERIAARIERMASAATGSFNAITTAIQASTSKIDSMDRTLTDIERKLDDKRGEAR